MIIMVHKEIQRGIHEKIEQECIHVERPYSNSDLILKKGIDYHYMSNDGQIVFDINTLTTNLKYIYQDAYRKGREDAINQMMHP